MKSNGLTLIVVVAAVVVLHSFKSILAGSVSGSIIPQDGALNVWAIQNTDTLRTTPVNGQFSLSTKAGSWKIIINAKAPYKDVLLENVQVNDGKETNLGEIRLQR